MNNKTQSINLIRPYPYLVLLLMLLSVNGFSQTKITVKDAKVISYQATEAVKNLQQLMNIITDPNNTPTDFKDFLEGSVNPVSNNRIFYNKAIIVEDDIDPSAGLGNSKDVSIEKYLNNLDVLYSKSTDPTIDFSNIVVSDIKRKDYLYINVKFDAKFSNVTTTTKTGYTTKQRQATLRLDNINNKWQALFVGISFYNPAKQIDSTDNDVELYTDTTANASVVTMDNFKKEVNSFITSKQEEERNNQKLVDEYTANAAGYAANKQYKEALELYDKARTLKTFDPSLDKKRLDTKLLADEYTYVKFKNKGDKAKNERRYELAVQHYQLALKLDPLQSGVINPIIAELTKQIAITTSPNSKLSSGLFDQTIEECKNILNQKENKLAKDKFPELFYLQGKAYEGLAAQKPADSKSLLEKSLENYNQAITYFSNYLDARLTRADFYVKYKNDYASAISDYDILLLNALDESPEKPLYFVTRAKLNDKRQTYAAALNDYANAINLNKTTASLYYDKGELLYRLNKYDEALQNFDAAIKLDTKYKNAYYYRGLNYVSLKNIDKAGIDFAETEKLGYEPEQLRKVDSISNNYFVTGEDFLAKHTFPDADSAYNSAIKIRGSNAQAWHGKAEIRLRTAEEAGNNAALAKSKYLESIDLNTKAFTYNKNFSDAYYKHGLANNRIANYDGALKSYDEAIRSDDANYLALTERGNTYQTLAKFDKAAADYTAAIAILKANYYAAKKGSKDSLAKVLLVNISTVQQLNGQALYNNKDYPGALLILDQSVNTNAFNAEALYYRGLAHVQMNDFSKAFSDYNAAIKVNPQYKYYYANAGAAYTYKKYDQAIINYSNAIAKDTLATVKNSHYLRGLSYFKNKLVDSTLIDFAAYEKTGVLASDSTFYADYGLAKLYANQDSSAITYLNKALSIKGSDAKALYSLGCAYAKLNQFDKALTYMEKALAAKMLLKDDIALPEKTFLAALYKDKQAKTKYNQLKSQYISN